MEIYQTVLRVPLIADKVKFGTVFLRFLTETTLKFYIYDFKRKLWVVFESGS